MPELIRDVRDLIRDVPDFPKPGIVFKDIMPVLGHPTVFPRVIDWMVNHTNEHQVDAVLGMESRGFIFAAPVAARINKGFIPARKPGKLPWKVESVAYDLEYGSAELQVHQDAFKPGARVMIADDLLATGGTARAAVELVRKLGGVVAGCMFLVELDFLDGRAGIDAPIRSLIHY